MGFVFYLGLKGHAPPLMEILSKQMFWIDMLDVYALFSLFIHDEFHVLFCNLRISIFLIVCTSSQVALIHMYYILSYISNISGTHLV
jgi:hypothetical protein